MCSCRDPSTITLQTRDVQLSWPQYNHITNTRCAVIVTPVQLRYKHEMCSCRDPSTITLQTRDLQLSWPPVQLHYKHEMCNDHDPRTITHTSCAVVITPHTIRIQTRDVQLSWPQYTHKGLSNRETGQVQGHDCWDGRLKQIQSDHCGQRRFNAAIVVFTWV